MCQESIEIGDVRSAREAYEVSETLQGVPFIESVDCDVLSNEIVVEYDESELSRDDVLDEIEYAGCIPEERRSGVLHTIRKSVGV